MFNFDLVSDVLYLSSKSRALSLQYMCKDPAASSKPLSSACHIQISLALLSRSAETIVNCGYKMAAM